MEKETTGGGRRPLHEDRLVSFPRRHNNPSSSTSKQNIKTCEATTNIITKRNRNIILLYLETSTTLSLNDGCTLCSLMLYSL